MTSFRSALAPLAVAIGGCLGIIACGSSEDTTRTTGGSIRFGSTLPDSYDPVLFLTTEANEPLQLVYTGLVTYAHEPGVEGTKLIPGLAEAMPAISSDRKTYTFKLRPDLRYSDGSPVRASDFENTIKRLNYLGGPFAAFTAAIEGIAAYQKAQRPDADISGIKTDDRTGEIVIKLFEPDGKLLYELALANAAPTPRAKSPFKASHSIPGIGPYTINVVNPTREYVLEKTAGFDIPGIAKGNIDKMTVVKSEARKMAQDVIDNKLDFMTVDPASDQLPEIRAQYANRFRMDANPPNTLWFFMNESVKPFDKLEVRQAVNYAIDSRALERLFGGRMAPTCNFLPPSYSRIGYTKIEPCPYGDPAGPPDLAMARQLVAKSGYGGMSVTAWGIDLPAYAEAVEYLRDLLDEIGFKAETKILDEQVYFETIGARKTKAQTGFTNWFQDFPHPADFFEPNLSAKALASEPTFNFEFGSNPEVDAGLTALRASEPATRAAEWAALDRSVVENANVAVYGNELSTSFFSERMDFENCNGVHPVYKHDWSLFCLK